MNLRIASLVAAGTAALLASSSIAQQGRSPEAEQKLANALSGRTAGAPVSCIRDSRNTKMQIIDDWTILYRDRGIIYVQKPRGGCHGLSNGMSLVRNQFGTTQMCRGDINQIVDLRTGFGTGACTYSEFVPYRKVG
jgi:hypothetical protein